MTDDKQKLIGRLSALKKALAAKLARVSCAGGNDDSQH